MARVVDTASRRAAGHIMLGLFHLVSSGVVHPLRTMTNTQVMDSTWRGLTPKERQLIIKKIAELDDTAELFRMLGWRLLKGARRD